MNDPLSSEDKTTSSSPSDSTQDGSPQAPFDSSNGISVQPYLSVTGSENSPAITEVPKSSLVSNLRGTIGTSSQLVAQTQHLPTAHISDVPVVPNKEPDSGDLGYSGFVNGDSLTVPQTSRPGSLSRAGLPTAAIAVPLSLLTATFFISIILCFTHRRSLSKQSRRNAQIIKRCSSVRSNYSTSKSSMKTDPDVEKAIDALTRQGHDHADMHYHNCGLTRSLSSNFSCHSHTSQYPVPRQDVRRERIPRLERTYEYVRGSRLGSSVYERTKRPGRRERGYSDCYTIDTHHLHSSRSLGSHRDLSRSDNTYSRRLRRDYGRDRISVDRVLDSDDECASSTTGSILSGYVSPVLLTPRLMSRNQDEEELPQAPPRSHSRNTAPDLLYDHHLRRSEDLYQPDTPPARSQY